MQQFAPAHQRPPRLKAFASQFFNALSPPWLCLVLILSDVQLPRLRGGGVAGPGCAACRGASSRLAGDILWMVSKDRQRSFEFLLCDNFCLRHSPNPTFDLENVTFGRGGGRATGKAG